jgi:hypothetical protein
VVEALCHKPEGRGFEIRLIHFSIHLILEAALGPGVYSSSNRNEYQKQKNNVSGVKWNRVDYYWGHYWPTVPAPDDDECGAVGGMSDRGNCSTQRKPALVSLCLPQIPNRTRAGKVGSRPLTAWATARLPLRYFPTSIEHDMIKDLILTPVSSTIWTACLLLTKVLLAMI